MTILQKVILPTMICTVLQVTAFDASHANIKQQDTWQTLYDQGQQAFSDGNYPTAERNFLNALDVVEKSKDWSRLRLTLSRLTRTFLVQNYGGTAEANYPKLQDLVHMHDNDPKRQCEFVISLDDLADTYEIKGNLFRDPNYLEHALDLRKSVNGKLHHKYNDTLRELAALYSGHDQYFKAIPVLEELTSREEAGFVNLKTVSKLNWRDNLTFGDRLDLAISYFGNREYVKAERALKQLLTNLPQCKKTGDWAGDIYSELASMYLEEGQYNKAEQSCKKAILCDAHRTMPMPIFLPVAFDYLLLGSVLTQKGNNREAEYYLRKCIALTTARYGDHPALHLPYKALAEFLSKNNRLAEAKIFLQKNQTFQQHFPILADKRTDRHEYVSRFPLMKTPYEANASKPKTKSYDREPKNQENSLEQDRGHGCLISPSFFNN